MDARALWRQVRAMDAPVSLTLGPNTTDRYLGDPRRIAFFLSRYKFAAKMLTGCASIADVGAGDGFGTLTFCGNPNIAQVHGYDFDEQLVEYAQQELSAAHGKARPNAVSPVFHQCDFMRDTINQSYDGVCSLDVVEHIDPAKSVDFFSRIYDLLTPCGVAVIGTPNELAAQYGSPHSKLGHINNFDPDRLRNEMRMFFPVVFMFSANDEMVHTGFDKLAHYLIAVGVKPGFSLGGRK